MAAGIAVPYNREGLETQALIHEGWPTRPGEHPVPKEFGTTNWHYGRYIPCHSGQSYAPPAHAAGQSKHISTFYRKTGCQQHRIEEGFRDTLGRCTLTEAPIMNYGTMRRSGARLPGAGSMVLEAGPPPATSGSSVASSGRRSQRSVGAASERSRRSAGGASVRSGASSTPAWASEFASRQRPWNFETLPMYERTNETYGNAVNPNRKFRDSMAMRPAGKSESGFLEPSELIATLTRPA
eukprot:TRINITY_DN56419_c0_g1_i1.p1 TRINITY_DN56419_c0_g1~~TRINITY_DN56419_c0_g1_i1.p1  ORF type:complete len:239 (+),score=28.90 TRINITY_DN56419_c0_g1_i1:228-944(+)